MSIDTTAAKNAIRSGYAALQVKRADWVRLAKLRPLAEQQMMDEGIDITMVRGMFIKAVNEMTKAEEFVLAPDSNRKVLVGEDHYNAIVIAGEEHHLLAQQIQD